MIKTWVNLSIIILKKWAFCQIMHQSLSVSKLVIVIITSTSVTGTNNKAMQEIRDLNLVICVYSSVLFQKNTWKTEILVLIDFKSKINVIKPIYVVKLGFQMQRTDIVA